MDSAKSDILGDTHDHRVCTRGDRDSNQLLGADCDTLDDPDAGILWCVGLDSAPDRSSRGTSELVRIRSDFPYYRGRVGRGGFLGAFRLKLEIAWWM